MTKKKVQRSGIFVFLAAAFQLFTWQEASAGMPPRYPGLKDPLPTIPALLQGQLFAATGDCQDPASVRFSLLETAFLQRLGNPPAGGESKVFIAPILRVSLFDDGSAQLFYRELKTVTAADGTETSNWVFASAIVARWEYNAVFPEQLALKGLDGKDVFGLAFTGMWVNGQRAIIAFPLGALDRPALKEHAPVLTLQALGDGPKLESGADYCRL